MFIVCILHVNVLFRTCLFTVIIIGNANIYVTQAEAINSFFSVMIMMPI